jgi:site-specific DNA recombinase
MNNATKKAAEQAEREKVKRRYANRREPDVIYPAKKQVDFYDDDVHQRVAVYVRVSTDNLGQETSYELQKNYYEEFVLKHPNWVLVRIYADKGISGTSTKHRDELNQMLTDCRAGKIDLIITKSVSRLARNTVDCITMVRNLAELRNPVGVFFESECIFSLNEDTSMPLSFLASIAENESRIRSRSMEVSLAQRLNGGLPLTPKLLGYSHNAEGKLVINPDEAPTVRLIFYMYLSGYSSSHIARTLEELGKTTYLGNTKWTAGAVIQVLRNERHCGDVLTRKTWTPDVISHKAKKNRGERQQSLYKDDHEAIVSRDDYIAVQHMINNAKYGGKSILPELRVIDSGLLKGYVTISPKWAGFKAADYLQASMSVYTDEEAYYSQPQEGDATFEVTAGDFDLRGFEVTNATLFDSNRRPYVMFQNKKIKFSTDCVRRFGKDNRVELLIHPGLRIFAVRRAAKDCRHFVQWSRPDDGRYYAREIPCSAFGDTLFELLDWETEYKFKAYGRYIENDGESVFLFDLGEPEIFIQSYLMTGTDSPASGHGGLSPLSISGKRVRAVPKKLADRFGSDFYAHRLASSSMEPQDEEAWKLWLEGQLFETGEKLQVTKFDEMQRFIIDQLSSVKPKEGDLLNE